MAWQCILKNNDTGAVDLDDLGISIGATTTYNAHVGSDPEFTHTELANSLDLKAAIGATFVVNDGTSDLSTANGLRHLEIGFDLTEDEVDAIQNANAPDGTNYFATLADLSGIGQDTLDSAYDGGGSGAGRTITADAGEVDITNLAAGNAGLRIAPRTTKATTLNDGSIELMKDASGNIAVCIYDGTRTKLLSITEDEHSFQDAVNTKDRYIKYGDNRSNEAGSPVIKNATLVKAVVKCQTAVTASAIVRVRSALGVDIATITLTAAASTIVENLDVDLSAGDELSVYWSQATGNADYPIVKLYTKERY